MCTPRSFFVDWLCACYKVNKKHTSFDNKMSSLSAQYPSQTLRVSNLVSYGLLIAVNVASNTGLLGPNNAEISQKYSTPLTPSG